MAALATLQYAAVVRRPTAYSRADLCQWNRESMTPCVSSGHASGALSSAAPAHHVWGHLLPKVATHAGQMADSFVCQADKTANAVRNRKLENGSMRFREWATPNNAAFGCVLSAVVGGLGLLASIVFGTFAFVAPR
jgi:hypothetical protein